MNKFLNNDVWKQRLAGVGRQKTDYLKSTGIKKAAGSPELLLLLWQLWAVRIPL